jgi:hypothetical protein
MKTNSTLLALVIGTFLCVGCGSDDDNQGSGATDNGGSGGTSQGGGSGGGNDTNPLGYCDVDNMGTHTCIDYLQGYTGSTPQGCAVLKGSYSATGSCSHANNVGGCKQDVGKQTIWYYSPITEEDVRVTCANNPDATFVSP